MKAVKKLSGIHTEKTDLISYADSRMTHYDMKNG